MCEGRSFQRTERRQTIKSFIRYKNVLQGVYNPAGTTRDFTGTYAFPLVPTSEFKRRLIGATLTQAGGNRTRATRALGLQRTYLLRDSSGSVQRSKWSPRSRSPGTILC